MTIPKLLDQLSNVPVAELMTQPKKIAQEREKCAALIQILLDNEKLFLREIKESRGRERRLEKLLFQRGAMLKAPCFLCGYRGPNYFQPAQHRCAIRHHRYYKEDNNDL